MVRIFPFVFTVLLFVSHTSLFSQKFDWAGSFGNSTNDHIWGMAVDPAGNIYLTGTFQGFVDFDPGPGVYNITSAGAMDAYIVKLSGTGNLVWAKTFRGTFDQRSLSIALDSAGNVITSGTYFGMTDFDPGPGTFYLPLTGGEKVFVAVLDTAGDLVWVKDWNASSAVYDIYDLFVDKKGDIYVAGQFNGSVDFDPGVGTANYTAVGTFDAYVNRLSSTGNFVDCFVFPSFTSTDQGISRGVEVDDLGNIYVVGRFVGSIHTGSSLSVTGGGSFMLKMDSTGNVLWSGSVAGSNVQAEGLDSFGNLYVTGYFGGSLDFDPGSGVFIMESLTTASTFILKLTSSGVFSWARKMSGTSTVSSFDIDLDNTGNIYITGIFEGTSDFDPDTTVFTLTSSGLTDCFITKLNSNAGLVYAKKFSSPARVNARKIISDNSGNLVVAGEFFGVTDFNPGLDTFSLNSNGSTDVFVAKLLDCPADKWTDSVSSCGSYTWINGLTYNSSNSTAQHMLVNSSGCDSLILLHLTVTSINKTVSVNDTIITSNEPGAQYQWIDCQNGFALLPGDTLKTFSPSVSGEYAVILTKNNCTDTSKCVEITLEAKSVENFAHVNFLIYPNPTKDEVFIEFPEFKSDRTLEVTDLLGNVYMSVNVNQKKQLIKLPDAKGVYLLVVRSQESVMVHPLVKQ